MWKLLGETYVQQMSFNQNNEVYFFFSVDLQSEGGI